MQSLGICRIGLAAMGMLFMTGCFSTRVVFEGPPGSVMFVEGKPHHLPAQIQLPRPGEIGKSTRQDVSLVAPLQSGELRAKGYIDVFGYTESDVDRASMPTCNLDEAQLARIFDGTTVVFRGKSASRQPIYELTLKRDDSAVYPERR